MSAAANKLEFLAAQMADHETNWSLGTFGAIAEFIRGADEPVAAAARGAEGRAALDPDVDVVGRSGHVRRRGVSEGHGVTWVHVVVPAPGVRRGKVEGDRS